MQYGAKIKDKLVMIEEHLTTDINLENQRIIDEINSSYSMKIDKATKSLEQAKIDWPKKMTSEAKQKVDFIVQKMQTSHSLLINDKQNEYTVHIYETLNKMIAEMSEKDKSSYLRKSLEEAFSLLADEKVVTVYVNEKDKEIVRRILAEVLTEKNLQVKASVEVGKVDLLGGVLATNEEKTLCVDCSIKHYLNRKRETIIRIIQSHLSEVMKID